MSEAERPAEPEAPKAEAHKAEEKAKPVGQVGEWRPSWFNFPKAVALMILAPLVGFAAKYWVFQPDSGSEWGPSLLWAAIAFGCVSLPIYLVVSLIRKTTTLALFTDSRVRYKTGVVARKSTEIMAKDIRSIDVTQTTWERILGIGKIGIGTAAQAEVEIEMAKTRNPEKIRAEINLFRDDDPSNDPD